MNKDDGGPAFPGEQGHCPDGTWNQTWESGASLWDYYAAHAPINYGYGNYEEYMSLEGRLQLQAKKASMYADALLAERKKRFGRTNEEI